MSASAVKFGLFTPACWKTLVVQQDFLNAPCLKAVIAKLIGFAIILGSIVIKVPQILKIVAAKSAQGLLMSSYALTLVSCSVNVAYSYALDYPFSSYGENVMIGVQDAIIILLGVAYSGGLSASFFAMASVFWAGVAFLLSDLVSIETLVILKTLNLPLFCLSRVPQIISIYRAGSTGQLSFITVFMQFGGSAARVATTLAETADRNELLNHGLCTFLNGVIFLQVLAYWGATNKALAATAGTVKKTN